MHKELIIAAFEKSKKELKSEGTNEPSTHQMSIRISNFITNDFGFSFGERSLTNYYNSALTKSSSDDISISQVKVVEGLCNYLGFNNYHEFYLNIKSQEVDSINDGLIKTEIGSKLKIKFNKSTPNVKVLIAMAILLIVGIFVVKSINKQQWMTWNGNQYEEADFNKEELNNGSLKLYKEERIENFKKIKRPDCDYQFFNEDGSVRIWYGKNKNGKLEYFTDIGLHPETGISLRPITTYMINKYICK